MVQNYTQMEGSLNSSHLKKNNNGLMLKIKMQTDSFCFTCFGVLSQNPNIFAFCFFFL